jgi:Cof subfamily protein (haloacid dehalogenase superfamily)
LLRDRTGGTPVLPYLCDALLWLGGIGAALRAAWWPAHGSSPGARESKPCFCSPPLKRWATVPVIHPNARREPVVYRSESPIHNRIAVLVAFHSDSPTPKYAPEGKQMFGDARSAGLPGLPTYDLLAIDLDGTLLDSEHHVPPRNRAALHAAHEAGLKIVVCTGRSYTETRPILNEINLDLDAAVTVGGALLTEVATGRTIDSTAIELEIALEAAEWFLERGYTVLWLRDATTAGFDGYLIEAARRHPVIDRWFGATPCRMHELSGLPTDGQPPLRVTIVDEIEVLDQVSAEFRRVFDGRLTSNVICVPAYGFTVLEAFDAAVDKWYGIQKLCGRWAIDPARTVAVGDDVNDLPMIEHAGLGVAVANAKPAVKRVAGRVVAANDECGIADFIEELLRG